MAYDEGWQSMMGAIQRSELDVVEYTLSEC